MFPTGRFHCRIIKLTFSSQIKFYDFKVFISYYKFFLKKESSLTKYYHISNNKLTGFEFFLRSPLNSSLTSNIYEKNCLTYCQFCFLSTKYVLFKEGLKRSLMLSLLNFKYRSSHLGVFR